MKPLQLSSSTHLQVRLADQSTQRDYLPSSNYMDKETEMSAIPMMVLNPTIDNINPHLQGYRKLMAYEAAAGKGERTSNDDTR